MPRKPCYWTRKLELQLIDFVKNREFIWKPIGNTNHHIQQKYKAYAEFAAILGRGFTARSVRDRWVNIRSTFNHNLRRVDSSLKKASTSAEVYIPCWPLWKPMQFLRNTLQNEGEVVGYDVYASLPMDFKEIQPIKEESDFMDLIDLRQYTAKSLKPQSSVKKIKKKKNRKCRQLLDDLVVAMKPPTKTVKHEKDQNYWFFGRHVTERLNAMRSFDATSAGEKIVRLLRELPVVNPSPT